MINIRYKSNVDFSNDNQFIPMTDSQIFKIEGRLVSEFIQPLDVADTWDGDDLTIQQTVWDGYFFEVNINESQTKMLGLILACTDILIEDTVYNITPITLDTSNPEYTVFEVGDKVGQTSNYKVTARFRSSPLYVNRQEVTTSANYIDISGVKYYSNLEILEDYSTSEYIFDDQSEPILDIQKKIVKYVNYTDLTSANALKNALEVSLFTSITVISGATTYNAIENSTVLVEPFGRDGLYRITVDTMVSKTVTNLRPATSGDIFIKANSTYLYSLESVFDQIEDVAFTTIEASDAIEEATSRPYRRLLTFTFYKTDAELKTFRDVYERAVVSSFQCKDGTTTFTILERRSMAVERLYDNYYKATAICTASSDKDYF